MNKSNISDYLWILASVLFRVAAGICAKQAGIESSGGSLMDILINPWYIAELMFLFFQALSWLIVLRKFDLGYAYPFMSTTIVFSLIAAFFIFNEGITYFNILGSVIIGSGVLTLSCGKTEESNL